QVLHARFPLCVRQTDEARMGGRTAEVERDPVGFVGDRTGLFAVVILTAATALVGGRGGAGGRSGGAGARPHHPSRLIASADVGLLLRLGPSTGDRERTREPCAPPLLRPRHVSPRIGSNGNRLKGETNLLETKVRCPYTPGVHPR